MFREYGYVVSRTRIFRVYQFLLSFRVVSLLDSYVRLKFHPSPPWLQSGPPPARFQARLTGSLWTVRKGLQHERFGENSLLGTFNESFFAWQKCKCLWARENQLAGSATPGYRTRSLSLGEPLRVRRAYSQGPKSLSLRAVYKSHCFAASWGWKYPLFAGCPCLFFVSEMFRVFAKARS